MTHKLAEDLLGLEFDWLAVDGDGHVALFSTAGGGYAPEEALRDGEAQEAAIDVIVAAPVTTRLRFVHEDARPGST